MSEDRPKVFGDYTLLSQLAQGGMGSIHLAKRVGFRADIQRFLVVKKLLRGRAGMRDLRRFEDEARIVVTLNHRALCQVFDVGIVDDEHYLAMELVEGVTLQRAMAATRFRAADALYVIDEMLDALDYAHQHKDPATGQPLRIVHRDVSPQNVMLSFSGAVKLIDFGLVSSTVKQEQTVGGVVVGKLEYMSPEQARAEPLDARSDVYAAAVIAFELLSGRRFYEGLSAGALMSAVVDGSHMPSFDGVDAPLVAPLMRALAGEREERTPSCAELQAELAAAAGGARGSSRDLRDALTRALPEEQARLATLMQSFRDVGTEPPPPDVPTKVRHIARSDEDARSGDVTVANARPSRGAVDISTEPTRIEVPRARPTPPPARRTSSIAIGALGGLALLALVVVAYALARDPAGAAAAAGSSTVVAAAPKAGADAGAAGGAAAGAADAADAAAIDVAAAAVDAGAGARRASDAGADAAAVVDAGAGAPRASDAGTDAAAVDVAAAAAAVDAGAAAVARDAGADADAAVVDAGDHADAASARVEAAGGAAGAPPRAKNSARAKRAKPPPAPLPDLAAHLDYLARWCTARTTCAHRVLAARPRIPLLDVAGLQALRRDAEACVVECRR